MSPNEPPGSEHRDEGAPKQSAAVPADLPIELRLYVAGQTPACVRAVDNLQRLCAQQLAGRHQLELIDLSDNPALARADEIIAIPTLVRRHPLPIRKLIGDLSDMERVLRGLELSSGGEG